MNVRQFHFMPSVCDIADGEWVCVRLEPEEIPGTEELVEAFKQDISSTIEIVSLVAEMIYKKNHFRFDMSKNNVLKCEDKNSVREVYQYLSNTYIQYSTKFFIEGEHSLQLRGISITPEQAIDVCAKVNISAAQGIIENFYSNQGHFVNQNGQVYGNNFRDTSETSVISFIKELIWLSFMCPYLELGAALIPRKELNKNDKKSMFKKLDNEKLIPINIKVGKLTLIADDAENSYNMIEKYESGLTDGEFKKAIAAQEEKLCKQWLIC
jgi:hypothetical protein